MDKPYQDNGNVFFKTFSFFNDKRMSGHHPDPEKREILESESAPNRLVFFCLFFLARPSPFACKHCLEGTEPRIEFELLRKHLYFRRSLGFGIGQSSVPHLTLGSGAVWPGHVTLSFGVSVFVSVRWEWPSAYLMFVTWTGTQLSVSHRPLSFLLESLLTSQGRTSFSFLWEQV